MPHGQPGPGVDSVDVVVDGLVVRYGRKEAVAGVDWRLGSGVHALVGPNGAGKSSLLGVMATARRPDAGQVSVSGTADMRARRRLTGFLPQDNLPRSRFTVAEFVAYAAWLRGPGGDLAGDAVLEAMDVARVREIARERISSLSGGQRRRVGIAAALVGRPRLLLLDEPSAGLDVAQRAELSRCLRRAGDTAAVVVSTHIVEDVLTHADTITVMDQGRFVFHGTSEEFCPEGTLGAFEERYLSLVQA